MCEPIDWGLMSQAAKKAKRGSGSHNQKTAEQVAHELKTQIRVIIRQYDQMKQRLGTVAEPTNDPQRPVQYRVIGADSPELLMDQMLDFAGSVWQFKDRLKKYVDLAKLDLREPTGAGKGTPTTIEAAAKQSLPLMICADLYNHEKHSECDTRSGYPPKLNGVELQKIDGMMWSSETVSGRAIVNTPRPVEWSIEIVSGDSSSSFGSAVKTIITGVRVLDSAHP
ncbi:MAG TPA: hypothetical protein VGR35_00335 [Tepidisphaeraceae bacterium]|nr:hypothetical protein [Tepidisphaeraceae bacterium]